MEYEPAPPPPDPDSWEAIPASPRPASLGRLGPVVSNELNLLQPRLARCFDEDIQARFGPTPVSRAIGGRAAGESAVTLLVLHLEIQPGQIRIVDAPVESQGKAADGLVACAQSILRGHVIRTPVARQEARVRLALPLHP